MDAKATTDLTSAISASSYSLDVAFSRPFLVRLGYYCFTAFWQWRPCRGHFAYRDWTKMLEMLADVEEIGEFQLVTLSLLVWCNVLHLGREAGVHWGKP